MNILTKGTNERVIHIEEEFRAPKEKIFKVWTTPEDLKKWFMAEEGVVVKRAEVDLTLGGKYIIEVMPPESKEATIINGIFQNITTSEYLDYTWKVNFVPNLETNVTVKFSDHGSGSKLYLTHGIFEDTELAKIHEIGWKGCIEELIKYLAN